MTVKVTNKRTGTHYVMDVIDYRNLEHLTSQIKRAYNQLLLVGYYSTNTFYIERREQ